MHASAHRIGTPSCSQVTDPLIRAALTENGTRDTVRNALLCASDVKTQELVTCGKHVQECFHPLPQKAAGITYSSASTPVSYSLWRSRMQRPGEAVNAWLVRGAPRGAGGV